MFNKEELLARWPSLTGTPLPPMEVVEFVYSDFTSPCSGQHIRAVRGARADFTDGLHFWIKAMEATDWYNIEPYFTTYIEAALCEPVGSVEFARVVNSYIFSLVLPLPEFVRDLSSWRRGLRMYEEWNDVAVIAELSDLFILFTWSTSA